MGAYINRGNAGFVKYTTSEYIDKTGMIAFINSTLGGADMLTCVTRPRRFGKSIAANMICAYYDRSCDSSALFENFEIAKDPSYKEHLNKYHVINVDVTNFVSEYRGQQYIDCDFDGVTETLECLVKGEPVRMNVLRFGNDISSVTDNSELFTLLIHFGYLRYDRQNRTVTLPNQEIREEFVEALRGSRCHKELSELVRYLKRGFLSESTMTKNQRSTHASSRQSQILPIHVDKYIVMQK